jgi:arsenate reductase (glutaredoxin)
MVVKIYGIPNCDSVKKAMVWFKENGISYEFHNYKTEGITAVKIKEWLQFTSIDAILNKKSTTWRSLTAAEQKSATKKKEAIKLLIANTSLFKRPIIELENDLLVGFDENIYKTTFKK